MLLTMLEREGRSAACHIGRPIPPWPNTQEKHSSFPLNARTSIHLLDLHRPTSSHPHELTGAARTIADALLCAIVEVCSLVGRRARRSGWHRHWGLPCAWIRLCLYQEHSIANIGARHATTGADSVDWWGMRWHAVGGGAAATTVGMGGVVPSLAGKGREGPLSMVLMMLPPPLLG